METVNFGVFVEAVLMLNTIDIHGMAVRRQHKKILHNLKAKLTEIFGKHWKKGFPCWKRTICIQRYKILKLKMQFLF